MGPVARHVGLHVVEAAFEVACVVVGVQITGSEPMDFEVPKKIGLLALWAPTQLATYSVQEGVAQKGFEQLVADPAGPH